MVTSEVKVYMCLGPGPIAKGGEISTVTTQEVHKVALGPSATEADAHTFASLRSALPAALRASICSSRAALLHAASSGAAASARC